MIKIGITGQTGFIGTHLYNYLGLQDDIERVPFKDDYFKDINKLSEFVSSCDAIVHLAAMNRHNNPEIIYETNLKLVNQIIEACEATNSKPHILFASSTQEERDNAYGKSKKEGRGLFEQWAERNNAQFTGFVIPNVYGPYGHPYYNSVVATFCHQLTHNETPKIDKDGYLKLIYVGELVQKITTQIRKVKEEHSGKKLIEKLPLDHTAESYVSTLLETLKNFKKNYFEQSIFPGLDTNFKRNLFNTFVGYIDHQNFFPFHLNQKTDNRGSFVETVKLHSGGQVSFSTTKPGIIRGNHYHTRKAERFAVIKGKARIEIRRIGTDKKLSFDLDGEQPSFVDMPIWYTHNIINTGNEDLYTIFWISEFFDPNDPDTFYEGV